LQALYIPEARFQTRDKFPRHQLQIDLRVAEACSEGSCTVYHSTRPAAGHFYSLDSLGSYRWPHPSLLMLPNFSTGSKILQVCPLRSLFSIRSQPTRVLVQAIFTQVTSTTLMTPICELAKPAVHQDGITMIMMPRTKMMIRIYV
jgi:hypothetical protein